MSDLDAIREDVVLAARSAEMARHVALDHAPELLDQIESLKSDVEVLARQRETLWHALEQILHVQLHESMEWETVQRIVDAGVEGFDEAYGYPEIPNSYLLVTTLEAFDELPHRAVVIEEPHGHVWIRHSDKWHCSCDGCGVEWTSAEVFDDLGCGGRPLTVLWLPEVSS